MKISLHIILLSIVLMVVIPSFQVQGKTPAINIAMPQPQGNVIAYEYWFDNDLSTKQHIDLNPAQALPSDLSSLITIPANFSKGVHTVSIKFKDTNNIWSAVKFFYINHTGAIYKETPPQTIDAYEYWYDFDTANKRINKQLVTVTPTQEFDLKAELKANNLPIGLHTLNIRFRNTESKKWSAVFSTQMAYLGHKSPDFFTQKTPKITAVQYWFNNNFSNNTIKELNPKEKMEISELFQVPNLPMGLHTVNMRFKDERNAWSSVITRQINMPYKLNDKIAKKIDAYEYWYDEDLEHKVLEELDTPVTELNLNTQLDAENLTLGLHTLNIRFRDNRNKTWGSVFTQQIANKGNASNELQQIIAVQYWFDGDYASKKNISFPPTDILEMDELFEVPDLSIGSHTVNMRFKDVRNTWSSVLTRQINIPYKSYDISEKLIDAYEYWYDEDLEHKILEELDTPVATFNLDTQLKAENLSLGLHTLNIRFRDNRKKTWGSVLTHQIANKGNASTEPQKLITVQYWFDSDYAHNKVISYTPTDMLEMDELFEVPDLSIGSHTVNMRFKDEQNTWSSVLTRPINIPYKTFDPSPKKIDAYEYWYDKDLANKEFVELATPVENFNLDEDLKADNLHLGLHTLNIRFRDNRNKTWGSVFTKKVANLGYADEDFINGIPQNIVVYQFWLDEDYDNAIKVDVSPTAELNLEKILELQKKISGIHTFNIRFKDKRGAWSSVMSRFINNRETQYEITHEAKIDKYYFWIDENFAGRQIVEVNPPQKMADIDNTDELLASGAGHLSVGPHTIHRRFRDTRKAWNSVKSSMSLIANPIVLVTPDVCAGEEVTFSNDLKNTTADRIEWDFGDGSNVHPTTINGNISEVKHAFPAIYETQTYTIVATITNSTLPAKGRAIMEYTVEGLPKATIISDNTEACAGEELNFTASGGEEYEFYLGTDTTGILLQARSADNTLKYIVKPGDQVTVKAFNSSGCNTIATTNITVHPKPAPRLYFSIGD